VPGDPSPDERQAGSDLPDLGATGAAMREEWRAKQEAVTNDAAEQWRHSRTLLDLARDHMHRGDVVAVTVAGHEAIGEVVEVARDRIALLGDESRGTGRRVDVHLVDGMPLTLRVVQRARAGGRSGARTATFRARLLELEASGGPVVLTTAMGGDPFTGILSVGADFVVIATTAGVETVIALGAVSSVGPAA
jgi:hypothetical protein